MRDEGPIESPRSVRWGLSLAILIGTGLMVGMTLGLLHDVTGLNPRAGFAVLIGIMAVVLVTRRRRGG